MANRPGARNIVLGLAACLVLVTFAGYWLFWRIRADPIEGMIADFQKRSIPPDGKLIHDVPLERDRLSATASWEIESDKDWDEYSAWVIGRFTDFKIRQLAGKIEMSKQLPGDTLHLSIEKIGEKPLRVRISFKGMAS